MLSVVFRSCLKPQSDSPYQDGDQKGGSSNQQVQEEGKQKQKAMHKWKRDPYQDRDHH
jgi:hypothetical protein